MGATIASAPKRHQNYLLITLAAAALRADLAPRHYRIHPTGRHAAGGAIGRFRPPAGSDGALRFRPRARRTPPRRASSSRWCGSPRCRSGGGRRARDAPGALDAHRPHQRRAAGTVRPRRHLPILGRRLVGLDVREVDRRRDDAIAACARSAEVRCVASMPTNQLRMSFAPMTSTRRAPGPPPAGLRHGNRSR